MIVCQCGVVTDRAVEAAVVAGARTVSAVCHATGAAQRCGTCVFTVKALICSHRERQLDMVDGAAGPGSDRLSGVLHDVLPPLAPPRRAG
jgi:bacterioferritin-associated ferredoxin